MTAQEKLNYMIGLYDWDEQTVKNVRNYAESCVEEALSANTVPVIEVPDSEPEGEAAE